MPYIKTHSNYVLKKNHQTVSDGTIWERDITTIGGVNQFAKGQTPIYKSSNFIITVRNDRKVASQYNKTKWRGNELSGDTWTLQTISGLTSENEDDNDIKIVLKQDYYDFKDFAYYGSLSEMFRASINDVLTRFPGELYGTSSNSYYTSASTIDGERIEESILLGTSGQTYLDNPFYIDLHSLTKPMEGKVIKFFANDGYQNYDVIYSGDTTQYSIKEWKSEVNGPFCIGKKFATITISVEGKNDIVIEAWGGDNNSIVYLSDNAVGVHIRPKEKYIKQFYNECDNFEKLLLNPKTTPKYKASFSVIKENDYGYYREIEDFVFPTSFGDYNIDALAYGFNDYTMRLAEIGELYDSAFTDNLYRSMTHEAIKNFDWTYTREFDQGDEEEYVHGGEKIQKALRIFAREFDEILSYINNIKNVNKLTYDDRNNIPNYFLTDEVSNKGWDVVMVYPYALTETYADENGEKQIVQAYDKQEQLDNQHNGYFFTREFAQDSNKVVNPYRKGLLDYPNGYFVTCVSGETATKENTPYSGRVEDDAIEYYYMSASANQSTYYEEESGRILNRNKSYSNERPYTYMEANNEFLKRLAINSPYIWRHKGTLEGVEMILGMFGLKSKRWVERGGKGPWDYEIVEYSSLTERIEDKWDNVHQMHRIDWINSTKIITYDTRSTSNYSKYGSDNNYVSYQGLPISYRDINGTRYLYPHFYSSSEIDGNPYFQMDGGWLSKTLENKKGNDKGRYNFQFDVDDNIAYTCHVPSGYTDASGNVIDNHPLYKETIRNIRRVDNIHDLLATPSNSIADGTIYYVSNIEKDVAVVDNEVFTINYEYDNGKTLSYISLKKGDDYIKIGDNKFFTDTIIVYDNEGKETSYNISLQPIGYEVKAYILENTTNKPQFICKADIEGVYTIDSFLILKDEATSTSTNYFIIDDAFYSQRLADKNGRNGWRRLEETDPSYIRINTIANYYGGNNPHNGNMVYDNGHEYFTYFKRLFKHASDNDLFDERCYDSFYTVLDDEISEIGFKGLIGDNEYIKQYDTKLIEDSKIHYFGSYYKTKDDGILETISKYNINDNSKMIGGTPYKGNNIDEITDQVVNNKRLTIKFNLHNEWHTNQGQCEVKYIDSIVMNYITQMIPSTAIVDVQYVY